MKLLQQFVKQYFLSEEREECLVDFLSTNGLIELTEMVIDQISQKNLPDLTVTASRFYTSVKTRLKAIEKSKDYEVVEGTVMEFSWVLMRLYYDNSQLSVSEFMEQLKSSIIRSAEAMGVDPKTLDKAFNWKRIKDTLPPDRDEFRTQLIIPEVDEEKESLPGYLLWNDDADFEYLEKVLVEEFEAFHQQNGLRVLFDKTNERVTCNANRLHLLAYLFRQLCPIQEDENVSDGRIVLVSPKGKLWEALSLKFVKPDKKSWAVKTLRNYCHQVKTQEKYALVKSEADTIVDHLKRKMI